MIENEKRIHTRKQLHEWINYEIKKYQESKDNFFRHLIYNTEFNIIKKHIILLRKTEYLYTAKRYFLAKFYYLKLIRHQNKYCIHIPLYTCGKGLKIMHVGPILINQEAKVYEDVSIHIGVYIVAAGRNNGAPTISRGCVLGVGSIMLGNILIGENVVIGANSLVNKTFCESNIAIAGSPAKKISNNGRDTWKKNK